MGKRFFLLISFVIFFSSLVQARENCGPQRTALSRIGEVASHFSQNLSYSWCEMGKAMSRNAGGVADCDKEPGTSSMLNPGQFKNFVTCENLRTFAGSSIPEVSATSLSYKNCSPRDVMPALENVQIGKLTRNTHDALECVIPTLSEYAKPGSKIRNDLNARASEKFSQLQAGLTQLIAEKDGFNNSNALRANAQCAQQYRGEDSKFRGLCQSRTANNAVSQGRNRQLDSAINLMLGQIPFGNQAAVRDKVISRHCFVVSVHTAKDKLITWPLRQFSV